MAVTASGWIKGVCRRGRRGGGLWWWIRRGFWGGVVGVLGLCDAPLTKLQASYTRGDRCRWLPGGSGVSKWMSIFWGISSLIGVRSATGLSRIRK